jgi:hypothetical protein
MGGKETEIPEKQRKLEKLMRRARKREGRSCWQNKEKNKRKPIWMDNHTLGRMKEAQTKKKISLERRDGGKIRAEPTHPDFRKAGQRFPRRGSREDFHQSRV